MSGDCHLHERRFSPEESSWRTSTSQLSQQDEIFLYYKSIGYVSYSKLFHKFQERTAVALRRCRVGCMQHIPRCRYSRTVSWSRTGSPRRPKPGSRGACTDTSSANVGPSQTIGRAPAHALAVAAASELVRDARQRGSWPTWSFSRAKRSRRSPKSRPGCRAARPSSSSSATPSRGLSEANGSWMEDDFHLAPCGLQVHARQFQQVARVDQGTTFGDLDQGIALSSVHAARPTHLLML